MGIPTPRRIRNPLGIPTPGMDLGPEIPPQKGPGTEIPPFKKDLGPKIPTPPPMNRQTPMKTLPSRKFVCGPLKISLYFTFLE